MKPLKILLHSAPKKAKQDKENPTLGIFEIKASGIPASF